MAKKKQYVEIKRIDWSMITLYPFAIVIGVIIALADLIVAFIPMLNIARISGSIPEKYFDWDAIKETKQYEVKTKK